MIEVSDAIEKAMELFNVVYAERIAAGDIVDVLTEEVELSHDEQYWTITLGFSRKGEINPATLGEALGQIDPKLVRKHKTFKIQAATGKIVSMKIRDPNRP